MSAVRVLIVDDSVVARRIITDILQAASDIEVAGTAASGSIALQKIALISPDVVLLDIEMPEMDGIETVTRIRQSWPRLPVIMCSSLTERGAQITLRAITAGASDCVAKPSALNASSGAISFGADLIAKVRALGGIRSMAPPAPLRPSLAPRPQVIRIIDSSRREPVSVIAIGSSTGGPNALATVFSSLPPGMSVPILITQHMPPMFTKLLAERLSTSSGFSVVELPTATSSSAPGLRGAGELPHGGVCSGTSCGWTQPGMLRKTHVGLPSTSCFGPSPASMAPARSAPFSLAWGATARRGRRISSRPAVR